MFYPCCKNNKLYVIGSDSDKSALRTYIKTNPGNKAIQRAQAILMSMEGHDRSEIAALYGVKTDTVSTWFKRWDALDLSALEDLHRSGRPPLLDSADKKNS